ncbi:MAG: type II secretion system F family protein [Pseudomonadota bacterium]
MTERAAAIPNQDTLPPELEAEALPPGGVTQDPAGAPAPQAGAGAAQPTADAAAGTAPPEAAGDAAAAQPEILVPEGISGGMMERLWIVLVDLFGPAGPFYAVAAIGLLLALVAIPLALRKNKDPLDRFSFRDDRLDDELVRLRTDKDDGQLASLSNYLEPEDQEEYSEVRTTLRAAGYRGASAVRVFYFTRAALGLGLLAVGLILMVLIPDDPDMVVAAGFSLAFGLAGYFAPVYWVQRQIAVRKEEIRNAFPDAMDMMLVCIEGGQSLDQAMARVGKEMESASGPLAEELQVVTSEFRAGKERVAVLRDFAERCAVNDISSFVTVMIQATAFGTSISQALRVYAAEMRDKRLMRAEEKANILPTKLTLGTMFFTVPPLVLILIGPSVIQIIRALTGLSSQ